MCPINFLIAVAVVLIRLSELASAAIFDVLNKIFARYTQTDICVTKGLLA